MEFFDIEEMIEDDVFGGSTQNIEFEGLEPCVGLESPLEGVESPLEGVESSLGEVESQLKPYTEKKFSTPKEAYQFYNAYARREGFRIRKSTLWKSRASNTTITHIFVCNKEGKRAEDKRSVEKYVIHRGESRCQCNAKIQIGLKSETWMVTKFIEKHEHPYTSPDKVSKHRSHSTWYRSDACRVLIDSLAERGLAPSTISRAVNAYASNSDDIVRPQQCIDHLRIERKNNLNHECVAVINHFQEKRSTDPEFYFAIELERDGTFRSVFWTDGRSRTSYLHFGDVVVFDVTYKTNKFLLPFAPFIGVNHHRQSTLFGCALLADEREKTFEWLFKQWLKCMWNKAPVSIITDQDGAMRNAIKTVFPKTHHRYCWWHLNKHVQEHLGPLRVLHGEGFENDFNKWFYSSTVVVSEGQWKALREKYKLIEGSWLIKLYEERHHWYSAYLKDTFFTGMRTSQRAESIHSFFDGYVHSMTPLHEFVRKYDNAIVDHRAAETDEDFHTKKYSRVLSTLLPLEPQAAKCYTRNLFKLFQQQLKLGLQCWHKRMNREEHRETKYIVGMPNENESSWKLVMYDNSDGINTTCEYALFETEGILCKHILNIMNKKQLQIIPEHYVLKRWTTNARYQMSDIRSGSLACSNVQEENEITPMKRWQMRAKCNKLMEEADKSATLHKEFDQFLSEKLGELEIRERGSQPIIDEHASQVDSNMNISQPIKHISDITIRDPTGPVKTKGRPKLARRIQSGLEQSQAQSQKKQRKCGNCGKLGHYITSCAEPKFKAGYGELSAS